jgi:ferric-dicitrate binding protein FerR (iron transport regulator)
VDLHFNSAEEVMANEFFLAWYYRTDEQKAKEWEFFLLDHQQYVSLVEESITCLKTIELQEKEVPADQVETAFLRLQNELDKAPVIELRPKKMRWWIPAAAAVLILVTAGLLFWRNTTGHTEFDSSYGRISEYRLPDGSQVILNAHSSIKMDKKWKTNTDREVWLEGEAFFKVEKTANRNRFIVHAKTMDIIVTGTQFNVVSREDASNVLLTEGSVTLRTKDGREIHMKPGDFVRVENNLPAKAPVDQDSIMAWKEAKLVFDHTPITEVAKTITRHYGIKVTLSGKDITTKTVSGVMSNDNLDVLITALEATGEYHITRTGGEIVISAP